MQERAERATRPKTEEQARRQAAAVAVQAAAVAVQAAAVAVQAALVAPAASVGLARQRVLYQKAI